MYKANSRGPNIEPGAHLSVHRGQKRKSQQPEQIVFSLISSLKNSLQHIQSYCKDIMVYCVKGLDKSIKGAAQCFLEYNASILSFRTLTAVDKMTTAVKDCLFLNPNRNGDKIQFSFMNSFSCSLASLSRTPFLSAKEEQMQTSKY